MGVVTSLGFKIGAILITPTAVEQKVLITERFNNCPLKDEPEGILKPFS